MVVLKPIKGSYTADIAKSQKTSKSTGRLYSALEGLRFSVDLPGFSGYRRSTDFFEGVTKEIAGQVKRKNKAKLT